MSIIKIVKYAIQNSTIAKTELELGRYNKNKIKGSKVTDNACQILMGANSSVVIIYNTHKIYTADWPIVYLTNVQIEIQPKRNRDIHSCISLSFLITFRQTAISLRMLFYWLLG